jgi:hypothetical protein
MKRINLLLALLVLLLPCRIQAHGTGMEGDSGSVPKVIYSAPADGSVVDLTGTDNLIFKWRMLPIPGGNRETYKFVLFKGSGYDEVLSQAVDPRTFSIGVPAYKFEDGAGYRWYVKQRDARTLAWSQHDDWYFKVIKK